MSLNIWTSGRTFRTGWQILVGLAATTLFVVSAFGQTLEPLPAPAGPVILTVAGSIEVTNGNAGAAFDRDMLYALGISELTTSTPWTDGTRVFWGVLARAVLDRVGATGATVLASALNDYTVEIPMEDFETYDVLLATEMDGEEMLVSDKGPIWIVYPRDSDSALQDRRLHDRWVWQLKALQVR
ncbi:molybdopterin-dependent oxidoreductase [Devosia beringensis]|uniref:molybdopterin-dependent oxidoreductase n=1 Tax=Devosia beringensis TaxID=2657486 RepID=UPI00186BAC96|nr:molybdopterin-dependent oxidoreductase [Devosia beringensis]